MRIREKKIGRERKEVQRPIRDRAVLRRWGLHFSLCAYE